MPGKKKTPTHLLLLQNFYDYIIVTTPTQPSLTKKKLGWKGEWLCTTYPPPTYPLKLIVDNMKDNLKDNFKDSFKDNLKDNFKNNFEDEFKGKLQGQLQGQSNGQLQGHLQGEL